MQQLFTHIKTRGLLSIVLIMSTLIVLSCEDVSTSPSSSDNDALFNVIAKIGNGSASTLALAFNENLGKVDKDKFTITKEEATNPLPITKIFLWEKTVYVTVSEKLSTSDTVSVTLGENAVYKADKSTAFAITESNNQVSAKAQTLPPQVITTIALPDSTNFYVLYDTEISAVAKDKFEIADNKITKVSLVEKEQGATKTLTKALAHYEYILGDAGITVDDFLGYVVGIDLENTLAKDSEVTVTTQKDAVTSIGGATSGETTNTVTVIADSTGPTITEVIAHDGAPTKVVVAFSEALGTTIALAKFKVQVNEGTAVAPSSAVAGAASHQVILTLSSAFAVDNTIKVTLEAGAVEDTLANKSVALETATSESSTVVKDGTAPKMTGLSVNDTLTTKVVVVFDEAVTVVDSTKFKIQINDGAIVAASSAVAGTEAEAHKITLTLSTSFAIGNTIKVTLDEGAV